MPDLNSLLIYTARKKIQISAIISIYYIYTLLYKIVQFLFGLLTLIPAIIDIIYPDDGNNNTRIIIVGSIISLLEPIIHEKFNYESNRQQAKQQAIKYRDMYQRLETLLSETSQTETLHDIKKELQLLELDDIDMDYFIRMRYEKICKESNIPIDDDVDNLIDLLNKKKNPVFKLTAHTIENINNETELKNTNLDDTQVSSSPRVKPRTLSKANYKKDLATYKSNDDLDWALERLATVNKWK